MKSLAGNVIHVWELADRRTTRERGFFSMLEESEEDCDRICRHCYNGSEDDTITEETAKETR